MSSYYTIYYNQQGEPYIIEKNFGHDPETGEGSSHWTWHITNRGMQYLQRGPFGQPQKMPRFINKEQLEDLKAYNMLRRSDGALIGVNPIYPSDALARPAKRSDRAARPATRPKRPIKPILPPAKKPAKPQRGLWGWLKSLLGWE